MLDEMSAIDLNSLNPNLQKSKRQLHETFPPLNLFSVNPLSPQKVSSKCKSALSSKIIDYFGQFLSTYFSMFFTLL